MLRVVKNSGWAVIVDTSGVAIFYTYVTYHRRSDWLTLLRLMSPLLPFVLFATASADTSGRYDSAAVSSDGTPCAQIAVWVHHGKHRYFVKFVVDFIKILTKAGKTSYLSRVKLHLMLNNYYEFKLRLMLLCRDLRPYCGYVLKCFESEHVCPQLHAYRRQD